VSFILCIFCPLYDTQHTHIIIHFFRARRDKTITNVVSACGTKEKDRRNYSLPEAVAPIPKQYALDAVCVLECP
jgi:hypothetical protein